MSLSLPSIQQVPRGGDGTHLEQVRMLLNDIDVNKKLKKFEYDILNECIEERCPYPAYLIAKLGADMAAAFIQEWASFEHTIVWHLLDNRSAANKILNEIVTSTNKMKNSEIQAVRGYFDDDDEMSYPEYLLAKVPEAYQSFLIKEKELFRACEDVLTEAIVGETTDMEGSRKPGTSCHTYVHGNIVRSA